MGIANWKTLNEWSKRLEPRLGRLPQEWFGDLCIAIASDVRFELRAGYARVCKGEGQYADIYSAALVRAVLAALEKVPGDAEDFLTAFPSKGIGWPRYREGTLQDYLQDEYSPLIPLKLTRKQDRFTRRAYRAIAFTLGYFSYYDQNFTPLCNPGLILTMAKIAMQLCPESDEKANEKRERRLKRLLTFTKPVITRGQW